MSQPRDKEARKIPYDRFCICGHIASDHWVSDRKGNLFTDKCRACVTSYHILNGLVCLDFRQDNLKYLEEKWETK